MVVVVVDVGRYLRYKNYLKSVDVDMEINSFIFHTMVINQQGEGKDLFLTADIVKHYTEDISVFDDLLNYVFLKPHYLKHIENIYSNCKLNKEVFSDDYSILSSVSDIKDAERGIMYFNDMEKWFNSRGMDITKPSPECIDIVNNTRKAGLLMKGSCHRFMSVDVKIRELFQIICVPRLYLIPDSDYSKVRNWLILVTFFDCYGNELLTIPIEDLWKYCGLYDTFEKALPLIKDL